MQSKFVNTLNAALNNDPNLKYLKMYTFYVDEINQILSALKNNTHIRSLSLPQKQSIGKECGAAIAELLEYNQSLQSLDLSSAHFTAFDFKAMCHSLTKHKSLKKLEFYLCNIGEIDPNCEEIAKVIKINTSIKHISLYGNNINVEGMNNIAEGLKANASINSLDLSRNPFGDDGAEKLAQVLLINSTLHDLNLVGCQIGNTGAIALANSLANNNSLRSLEIWKNNIGDEGVEAIANALKQNSRLQKINLLGNSFGARGEKALIEMSKINKKLKEIRPYIDQLQSYIDIHQ